MKKKQCDIDKGGCGRSEEFVPTGNGGGHWAPIKLGRDGLCLACKQAIAEATRK